MKKLTLKKLLIENWRGMTMTVEFKDDKTIIRGSNGTGKSHLPDAFHWLFEGVDSQNRTNYDLYDNTKELTYENSIPAVAEAIIDYNGSEYSFKRTAKQKWVRKRGKAEYEKASSDEYLYYVDGLAVSANNYWERIEQMFAPIEKLKLMLNVRHYQSLDWKVLRKHFADIVGTIDESELIGDYSDLTELLKKYENIDAVKDKLSQDISPLKKACDKADAEIKGMKATLPDISGLEDAKANIALISTQISEIDNEIMGLGDANKPFVEKRNEELRVLGQKKAEMAQARGEWEQEQNEAIFNISKKLAEIDEQNRQITKANEKDKVSHQTLENQIETACQQAEFLKEELERLRSENQLIKARSFDENLICPTCGQNMPSDMVNEAREKFYLKKEADHNDCVARGLRMKEKYEQQCALAEALKVKASEYDGPKPLLSKDDLEKQLSEAKAAIVPFEKSGIFTELMQQIADIESNLTVIPQVDASALLEQKKGLMNALSENQAIVALESEYNRIKQTIFDKEQEHKSTGIARAKLEKLLFKCIEREREWASIVRDRANKNLSYCNVEMTELSKAGETKDICSVSIDGVDVGVANTARQLVAGIDIAEAFQLHYGLNLPLFVDNAEQICDCNIPAVSNQMVLTYVDDNYNKLNIF